MDPIPGIVLKIYIQTDISNYSRQEVGEAVVAVVVEGDVEDPGRPRHKTVVVLETGELEVGALAPPLRQGEGALQGPLVLAPVAVVVVVFAVADIEEGASRGVGADHGGPSPRMVARRRRREPWERSDVAAARAALAVDAKHT